MVNMCKERDRDSEDKTNFHNSRLTSALASECNLAEIVIFVDRAANVFRQRE